jgi:hypothetical protein
VRAIVSAGALKDKPGAPELVRNVVSALCDLSTITPESTMVKSPGKSPPPVVTDPNSVQPGSARNEMVLNVFEVIGLLASNLPENGGPVAEVLQMATAHTVDQMSSLMNESR